LHPSTGHGQKGALIGVLIAELSDLLDCWKYRAVVSVVEIDQGILLDEFGVQGEIKPEKTEWIPVPIFIGLDGVSLNIFGHALVVWRGCIE
jgi:hypothetical protein